MIRRSQLKTILAVFLAPLSNADLILIAVLIAVGFISFYGLAVFQQPGNVVQVYVNDRLFRQYPLNHSQKSLITTGQGSLEICIADKKVWVSWSSCPTKTCMLMGKISRIGQVIVCLPNNILICIAGNTEEGWIDTITQ